VRRDFPILAGSARDRPLVYLDNASTTHKPQAVIDRLIRYYASENANVHRGVHWLSERATAEYEGGPRDGRPLSERRVEPRDRVRPRHDRGNQPRRGRVRPRAHRDGDEVLVTGMEHHSNIVPWQLVCEENGARLVAAPVTGTGELDVDAFTSLLTDRTRVVTLAHVSNALGTINPVRAIVDLAHCQGIPVLVDGAQATRFSARPASASSTASWRGSSRCRRIRAAAT
jgi:cysteine desulfurase / selenocysteine lyase